MYVAQSGIPKPIRRSPMRLRWYGGICGIIFIFPCHNRRPTWYKSRGLYSSALWTRCPMPRRWIKSSLAHVQNTNSQYNLPEIGKKIAYKANREGVAERFAEAAVQKTIEVDLALITYYDQLLKDLELSILKTAKHHD